MNVLDGTVIGRNMQHHRHQEFICFLNVIEKQVPSADRRPHVPAAARLGIQISIVTKRRLKALTLYKVW